jgi:hypothetical protein
MGGKLNELNNKIKLGPGEYFKNEGSLNAIRSMLKGNKNSGAINLNKADRFEKIKSSSPGPASYHLPYTMAVHPKHAFPNSPHYRVI